MTTPMIAGLGTTELLLILAVVVLLFGASKLPDLARGSGRALRIFKAETKGLMDDDDVEDEGTKTPEKREVQARQAELRAKQDQVDAQVDAEVERERHGDTAS